MLESNINITSNIYIRKEEDIKKDKRYTENITGAALLCKINQRYGRGLDKITLSSGQERIVGGAAKCVYDDRKEVSYGPVLKNGVIRWENRCENSSCKLYDSCMSSPNSAVIHREDQPEETVMQEREDLRRFMEDIIGIKVTEDIVEYTHDKSPDEEEEPQKFKAPTEQSHETAKNSQSAAAFQYEEISAPDPIIKAPISSHIILNSGPGTGKTYTIIQRLIYILSNGLCPADEIYILCYTRSAKGVIENKLEQAVTDGLIPPSAQNICVLTFDSYATYFLMEMKEQGVIDNDLSGCDYNERIRLFNKHISSEDFEGVRYFIVDEIQDLVNERAEMVLDILKYLKCGYLLAGDRCQSIYDYEADKDATLDSVEFYRRAEAQFPEDMQRYEIVVNRRQCPELAMEAHKMREVLLHGSVSYQNLYAKALMGKYSEKLRIEKYIETLTGEPSVSTAVLCRNNGEAEYISSILCKKGIPHSLNRGVNNQQHLPKWIADVFWDYCRERMSKSTFMERLMFRSKRSLDSEKLWLQLCKLADPDSEDTSSIEIRRLISSLGVQGNIPNDFYTEQPKLSVSTIHKAKGSEFDRVILIESKLKLSAVSAEEARIRYVALTRPKSQFVTMKKKTGYYKRTITGRVIETGLHGLYSRKNKFCKSITIGLSGDIDTNSFVSGTFGECIDRQEYISSRVSMYDKLSVRITEETEVYEILHKGRKIGVLSDSMVEELRAGIMSTDYKYNMPIGLEDLYVSGITTELLNRYDDTVPLEFQRSRIVYGIQITGLAKLIFEKRK